MPPLRILGQSQAHYCYDNRLKLSEQRDSNPSLRSPTQDIKPMRIRLLQRHSPHKLYSVALSEQFYYMLRYVASLHFMLVQTLNGDAYN